MNNYAAYESCAAFLAHLQDITNLTEAFIETRGTASTLTVDLMEHLSLEEQRSATTFCVSVTATIHGGILSVGLTLPQWDADYISTWIYYQTYYDFKKKSVGLWMENYLKPMMKTTPEQFERMKKLRHLFLLLGHYPIHIQGSMWQGMSSDPRFPQIAQALREFNQDLLPCSIREDSFYVQAGPHLRWVCPFDNKSPYIEAFYHSEIRDTTTLLRETRLLHELTQYINRTIF